MATLFELTPANNAPTEETGRILTKPNIVLFNGSSYYESKDLFTYDPVFYFGCKSNPRSIVVKKNIPSNECVYAVFKNNKWSVSTSAYKKAQLLLSETWANTYFFKQNLPEPLLTVEPAPLTLGDTVTIRVKSSYKKAPPLLYLEDSEKFHDASGNIYEIETRGDKTRKGIYFKVSDVASAFNLQHLDESLLHKEGKYTHIYDYNTFLIPTSNCTQLINSQSSTNRITFKKCMYLSYRGLVRVLFVSRNTQVNYFQDWAEDKLFTIQMGTQEEKLKLGTNILGISAKTYKAVFNTYATKFPSIYLLSLGKVGDLRESMAITDPTINNDLIVYKFGFTDDLTRRFGEHEATYAKYMGVALNLATFHTIDIKYAREAETQIKELCVAFGTKLHVSGRNELVVLDSRQYIEVKKAYTRIGAEFAGATLELQTKIQTLTCTIGEYKHEIELLHKTNEINMCKIQAQMFDLEKQNYELRIQVLTDKLANK